MADDTQAAAAVEASQEGTPPATDGQGEVSQDAAGKADPGTQGQDNAEWHNAYTPEQVEELKQFKEKQAEYDAYNTQNAQKNAADRKEVLAMRKEIEAEKRTTQTQESIRQEISNQYSHLSKDEQDSLFEKWSSGTIANDRVKELEGEIEERDMKEGRETLNRDIENGLQNIAKEKYKINDPEIIKRITTSIKMDMFGSDDMAKFDTDKAIETESKFWAEIGNSKAAADLAAKEKDAARPVQGTGDSGKPGSQQPKKSKDEIYDHCFGQIAR